MPAKTDLTENEVNAVLIAGNGLGDHVPLRRSMIDHQQLTRTIDGASYRRVERPPTPSAQALITGVP
ncbi:MAG: DUF2087 domain-containing protein [Yoonia sp.]|nr:DUF2087 domain-containing protein [Yoonia sp.]MDG1866908.1 DUF2087 domain-containing protein [Yoonia sp.]